MRMPRTRKIDEARWREEMTASWLTAAVARAEKDAAIAKVFEKLAAESARQAGLIAPSAAPAFRPSLRARSVAALAGLLGPHRVKPLLSAAKVRGVSLYDPMPAGHATPTDASEIGARHRRGGGLRAAVFGANDGIISNTSLVMGMTGAAVDNDVVFLTGVAGLLAGAFSMAAGEYVSVRTQREMLEHQIAQETEELDQYPEQEAEELALIYAARGMAAEDARAFARKIVADPDLAIKVLAREELGLDPDNLGSASQAAIWSFASFAVGAILPVIPFALGLAAPSAVAAGVAAVALFGVGAATSLFSGRNAFLGGVRMLTIGAAAGAATFFIGRLFGVAAA
jgi:VIT1/CCC1 family predicted Fe2+/Mn2+ transporter